MLLQLGPFLGQATPTGGVIATLTQLPALVQGTQPLELLLSVITLAILWFTPSAVKKFCPPQLLALVAGTLLSMTLFASADLRTIPDFAAKFPTPSFEGFDCSCLKDGCALLSSMPPCWACSVALMPCSHPLSQTA